MRRHCRRGSASWSRSNRSASASEAELRLDCVSDRGRPCCWWRGHRRLWRPVIGSARWRPARPGRRKPRSSTETGPAGPAIRATPGCPARPAVGRGSPRSAGDRRCGEQLQRPGPGRTPRRASGDHQPLLPVSVGLSNSNPSKPSASSTAPARAANAEPFRRGSGGHHDRIDRDGSHHPMLPTSDHEGNLERDIVGCS